MAFLVYLDDTRTSGQSSYGPFAITPEAMRVIVRGLNTGGLLFHEKSAGNGGYVSDIARLAEILLNSDAVVKTPKYVKREWVTHLRLVEGYKISSYILSWIV
jgi:hypothetical protein